MELRRINFDHGAGCGCGDCTGGNAQSYFEGLTQVPNVEQIVPVPGPAGVGSVLVAGKTSSTGVLNADGTDEALDATAKTNLAAANFDIEVKSTTQNVVDTSDVNNNKVWTGLSKGLLNLIGLKILPARVKDGGTAGQVYRKINSTDYNAEWADQTGEIYNTTTTTSYAYNVASIDTTQDFTVSAGLSYKFRHNVAIVNPSDSTKFLLGIVTAYSGTTLSVLIKDISGTGTTTNWSVMLSAPAYFPSASDPANYGKYFYNNAGIIEMRTSIESVGDTKIWFSSTAPDTSWWLCDGSTKLLSESPGLYNILVTQNGGVSSPFYVSATSFTLPNSTGATLVGVKGSGSDSITLGEIKGANILTGGIPATNLPVAPPYPVVLTPANTYGLTITGGSLTRAVSVGTDEKASAGLYASMGNNTGGGQDLDMRQRSLGMYLFIKAL